MPTTLEAPPNSAPSGIKIAQVPPSKAPSGLTPGGGRVLSPADVSAMPGEPRQRPGSDTPSTKQSIFDKIAAKGNGEKPVTQTPTDDQKPVEAENRPGAEEAGGDEQTLPGDQPAEQSAEVKTAEAKVDPKTGKTAKANPWKLYDTEKKARAAAEAEVQRLKTSVVPEQERTAIMERVTKAERRAKQLEDHIRFVDYEKSSEFAEKYHQPYVDKLKDAMALMARIPITDPVSGQQRAANENDLFELMAMDPVQQQKVAETVFGPLAAKVISKADAVQDMVNARAKALEDAKKNGTARQQQQTEAHQRQQAQVQEFVQKAWKDAQDGFLSDKTNSEYFKPKEIAEGQQPTPEEKEWNDALERGFKLVDEAWGGNAMAPNLTPEQRQSIIKKNVAVRNRAAAFGPLKRLAKRLEAKIAKLESDLKQYSGSTPGAGGSQTRSTIVAPRNSLATLKDRIAKAAR